MAVQMKNKDVLTKTEQVAEHIRQWVKSGKINSGDKLPGDRDLARQMGVAYLTIRRANTLLMKEGLLRREQGRGTFVSTSNANHGDKPVPKIRHLAFFFADVPANLDYNLREIMVVERWLAQRSAFLSVSSLTSNDLAAGSTPPVLTSGGVDGIFFDGHVADFHCAIARKNDIPFIVMGNHKLSRDIPQIRFNFSAMAARATRFLAEQYKLPVALFVEPMEFHYTHELFAGYLNVAQALPQRQSLLHLCPHNDADQIITHLLDQDSKGFAIVTTDRVSCSILDTLRKRGLNSEQYPMVVIGNPQRISTEDRRKYHLIPVQADQIALRAAQALVDIVEQKRTAVYEEIDAEIVSPEKPAGSCALAEGRA